MRRKPIASLILAVALAVLPPLEQAHCAAMAAQHDAAHAACTRHACCTSAAASAAKAAPARPASAGDRPSVCVCGQLPVVTLPSVPATADAPSTIPVALPADSPVLPPAGGFPERLPTLDIGSPPLPDDPGAHGLRAPPSFA